MDSGYKTALAKDGAKMVALATLWRYFPLHGDA
jgi:hypothetical protein